MSSPFPFEIRALEGPHQGLAYKLRQPLTNVGRGFEADVVVHNDRHCSRVHATFFLSHQGLAIEDQRSMNGTFVNGVKISTKTSLKAGDRVKIGHNLFVVVAQASPETDPPTSTKKTIRARQYSLEFRLTPREEDAVATSAVQARRRLPTLLLALFSFVSLLTTARAQPDATLRERTPSLGIVDHHWLGGYRALTEQRQWDNALVTAVWAVAWQPTATPFQEAVSESAQVLNQAEYLLQKRRAVLQLIALARDSYLNRTPGHIPLILTQAILDFKLTEGLTDSAYLLKETQRLNQLARYGMITASTN